jgi:hypothetical protein
MKGQVNESSQSKIENRIAFDKAQGAVVAVNAYGYLCQLIESLFPITLFRFDNFMRRVVEVEIIREDARFVGFENRLAHASAPRGCTAADTISIVAQSCELVNGKQSVG